MSELSLIQEAFQVPWTTIFWQTLRITSAMGCGYLVLMLPFLIIKVLLGD